MAYVQAIVRADGIAQSTVLIADAVWSTGEPQLRREALARGYDLEVLTFTPEAGGIDKSCDDLASACEWLVQLDPSED
jgi:hypothetical protein